MNKRVAGVICCPLCHGALRFKRDQMCCEACGAAYRIQTEVPVFVQEPLPVVSADHRSNPIGADFEVILRDGNEFVLHIGAGATDQKYRNCIELDRKIFRHTDVVGDAHALPFRDNAFDRVFAFNVFEHLRDPKKAAGEILRVLKPGGAVALHTAFLQALHEEPRHFYNATEFGVRSWFDKFEVESCRVSGNFGPGVMLAFLMSSVIDTLRQCGVSGREQLIVRETTVGEWADFWAAKTAPPPGFEVLQNLPQTAQGKIAAGFELIARKPIAE
jgi:SAM-dependent methyltransferase